MQKQSAYDLERGQAAIDDAKRMALYTTGLGLAVGGTQALLPEVRGWLGRMQEPYVDSEGGMPLAIEVTPEGTPKKRPKKKVPGLAQRIPGRAQELVQALTASAQPKVASTSWSELVSGVNTPAHSDTVDWAQGYHANDLWGVPWLGPAMGAGLLGGAWLGNKATKTVMTPLRKNEVASEVDIARKEYEDELAAALNKPAVKPKPKKKAPVKKLAAEEKPTDLITQVVLNFKQAHNRMPTTDEMYRLGYVGEMTKEATGSILDLPYNLFSSVVSPQAMGTVTSAAGIPLGMAAAGGGLLGWNLAEGQIKAQDLAKKLRERRLQAMMGETPPMYAVPVFPDEDEEKTKKTAEVGIGTVGGALLGSGIGVVGGSLMGLHGAGLMGASEAFRRKKNDQGEDVADSNYWQGGLSGLGSGAAYGALLGAGLGGAAGSGYFPSNNALGTLAGGGIGVGAGVIGNQVRRAIRGDNDENEHTTYDYLLPALGGAVGAYHGSALSTGMNNLNQAFDAIAKARREAEAAREAAGEVFRHRR